MTQSMIGRVVGNYQIVDRLGEGGMGSVYRAVDRMLDREIAIKVLRPDLSQKDALIERFRQEAKALARLGHPYIATLYGLEQHDDELLMIMEFVRGDTLEALVERSGRLSWPRACEICISMLDALDHAHEMGVVHRDIKPANIMLAHNGAVKVMDFGIARMLDRTRQTQVGHAVGTPRYMAPEQIRGMEVDGRTDLYATGAVLFELITGHMAFDADSDYALMMKKLSEPPPPPSTFVPDLPEMVDQIVFRAMANEPAHRFPNALAFRQELTRALELAPAASRTLGDRRSTPAPETRLAVHPTDAVANVPADQIPVNAAPPETPARLPQDESPREERSGAVVGDTRLAEARPVAETRLASAPTPSTDRDQIPMRIGVSPAGNRAPAATPWRVRWNDWRVYAGAGMLFVAVGLGARALRKDPATATERPPIDSVAAPVSPVGGESVTASPSEDAASLRIAPPQGAAPSGPANPPPSGSAPPSAGPPPAAPPAGAGRRDRSPEPPVQTGRNGSGTTTGGSSEPPQSDAGEARPVPPPVTSPPAPVVESANVAREAIRIAVGAALGELAEVPGTESLLQGNLRSDWIALAKERRISVGTPQAFEVDLQGSHAVASFSSDVNVRSPFGANRKRTAQFTAELQRDGSRWRVVSVRPTGALSLK